MAGMRYQPSGRIRLDWSNPLTRELVFAWTASGPDVNLVTGRPATWRGTPAELAAYPNGLKREFVGTGSLDFGYDANVAFHGQLQQTIFADVFIPDTVTVAGYICGRVRGAWDYHLGVENNVQQFRYAAGAQSGGLGAPASSVQGALKPFEGRPVAVCGTYDRAVGQRVYLDGQLISSNTQTTAFNPNSQDPFAIGARGGGGQAALNGASVGLILLFRRALSAEEALSLSSNPWQLFAAEDDFDDLPASAVQRVLAVAAAALALTAGQVRMTVSRRLSAAPASLSIGAGQVLMLAARRLAVAPAGMSIVSGDVVSRASRRLAVDRALLSLDPGQVAMRASRRITVKPAAIQVAAGNVSFDYNQAVSENYVLPVTPAAMVIGTGRVQMKVTRRLAIQPAVLQLVGGNVRFETSARAGDIDAAAVPAARTVRFGGGQRTVIFSGGTRVVTFNGGTRIVRF